MQEMKRARLADEPIVSSTSKAGLGSLREWLLRKGCKGLEEENVEFRASEACGGSLGCFSMRDFVAGDVIFEIPQSCLFGINTCQDTELTRKLRATALSLGNSHLVTSELLIWVHMIDEARRHKLGLDMLHGEYFASLDAASPSPLQWPQELCDALMLGSSGLACL